MSQELDNLRSRLDLLDLAKDYVRGLRRAGKSWTGLCPFHEEKSPSFHISPEKGVFHCFGCNAGGDAIAFYMKAENMPFREAVESLCERFGVPKPQGWSVQDGGMEAKMKATIQKALALAAQLYAEALWIGEDPLAETARKYLLNRRRIDKKIIQQYKIGLAPRGPAWLLTRMVSKHGIEQKVLEKAGLITLSSRDGRYLDFFRGRILFPVTDLNGKVSGFGGRVLGDDANSGPKYLNSVDSPFFKKSDTLYGLHEHKNNIRDAGKAYVVEGYFDATGMAQAGVPLAVSPMGGSITPGHAKILRRFTDKAVLLFDPDSAGIAGAIRAARILVATGAEVTVLKIPSGLDPDEYLLTYGKQAFETLEASEAKNFIDFELEHRVLTDKSTGSDLQKRMGIARAMLPSLASITGEVDRRESLVRMAQVLRLDPVGVERELWKEVQGSTGGRTFQRPSAKPAAAPSKRAEWELTLEEALVGLAAADLGAVKQALGEAGITKEDFQNHKIGEYFFGKPAESYDLEWQELVSRVSLSQDWASVDWQSRLTGYVHEVKRRKLHEEKKLLETQLQLAKQQGKSEIDILVRLLEVQKILKSGG